MTATETHAPVSHDQLTARIDAVTRMYDAAQRHGDGPLAEKAGEKLKNLLERESSATSE